MTFIDWIQKVETDARLNRYFESKACFRMCFHGFETFHVSGCLPGMKWECKICQQNSDDCKCYEEYKEEKLPAAVVDNAIFRIKNRI